MSRLQQVLLTALSLLATVLVLVEGGRDASSTPVALKAAAQTERTITTPLLAGAGDDDADSAGDDTDADADAGDATDDAADDGGSYDDSATAATDDGSADDDAASEDDGSGDDATSDDGGSGPGTTTGDDATTAAPKPTKIRHVFVISLAGHGFDAAFGAQATAPYLAQRLRPQGALLEGFTALGSGGLPDLIAQIGGQPPNAQTRAGCPTFTEIPLTTAPGRDGQIRADGCVFPNTVTTLGDQLSASRRTWRAYVEDLDRGPDRRATCRRPASNAADDTLRGRVGDGYATRLNPFVYFHSLLDLGDCDALDGGLERLQDDLKKVATTPSYSFVAPNLCNSGSESPCADGSAGGLPAADAFLATWVPRILASPAYRRDGLLIVTFSGRVADAAAPVTGATVPAAPAPDLRNGTLLVSRFAKPGTSVAGAYDPYSLLRSVEDAFGLRALARAAKARSFAPTVLADAYVEAPSDG